MGGDVTPGETAHNTIPKTDRNESPRLDEAISNPTVATHPSALRRQTMAGREDCLVASSG